MRFLLDVPLIEQYKMLVGVAGKPFVEEPKDGGEILVHHAIAAAADEEEMVVGPELLQQILVTEFLRQVGVVVLAEDNGIGLIPDAVEMQDETRIVRERSADFLVVGPIKDFASTYAASGGEQLVVVGGEENGRTQVLNAIEQVRGTNYGLAEKIL